MRYFILVLTLLITGCASYSPSLPSIISPYKLDIQQGNVVTPKMMLQLRPGMTKAQVSFVMGTPLLTDTFHADHWDYFYQMSRDGKILDQRRITLDFEGDLLRHIHGDVIPTGKGDDSLTVKPINEPKADLELDGKPKRDEKSWLDKLKFWGDDEKAKPVVAPKVEAQPEANPESGQSAAPVPAATPAPAPEEKATDNSTDKPAPEKKSWLDKLKFWDNGDKKPAVAPVPAAVPAPAPTEAAPKEEAAPLPAAAPEAQPEAAPEPASVSEPKPEAAPEPAPAPAPAVEEAKPEVVPAPVPAPVPEPKPVAAPSPAPAPVPSSEAAPQPKTEEAKSAKPAKPAPDAEKVAPTPKDLPPEDAPDYFERMLEKIGF